MLCPCREPVPGRWRRWVGGCLGERRAAPGGQLVCHLSLLSFAKPKCKNELKKKKHMTFKETKFSVPVLRSPLPPSFALKMVLGALSSF